MRRLWLVITLGLACGDDGGVAAESTSTGEASGSTTTTSTSTTGTSGEGTSTSAETGVATSSTGMVDSSSTGDAEVCESVSPFNGAGDCDPYAQDCPEGQRCAAAENTYERNVCVDVLSIPVGVGEPCTIIGGFPLTGVDNCDVGLQCWGDLATRELRCVDLCDCGPETPACADGSACIRLGGADDINERALPLCLPTCDPLADAPCGPGEFCFHRREPTEPFVCIPDPSTDELPAGMACNGSLGQCGPGTLCTQADLVPDCGGVRFGCCATVCDAEQSGADCVVPGTQCIPFYPDGEAPLPSLEGIGYCGT